MRSPNIALATLFATLLSASSACAQLSTAWITQYGTSNDDSGTGIVVDSSGQGWVSGWTYGNMGGTGNAGGTDVFLSRISSTGSVLSTVQRGSTLNEVPLGIALLGSTSIFTGGWTAGAPDGQTNAGGQDTAVFRYTAAGGWQNTILTGGSATDNITGLAANSTNVFGAGDTMGSFAGQVNAGDYDAFITKMDATGVPIWTRFVGTTAGDLGTCIALDAAGNSYLAGSTGGTLPTAASFGAADCFVVKFDPSGNRLRVIERGTSTNDNANAIKVDVSGNIYLAGGTLGNLDGQINQGLQDGFLTKLDSSGNLLWTRLFGGSGTDAILTLDLDSSGNPWVGGQSNGTIGIHTSAGGFDAFVASYDSTGNLLGTQFFGTAGADRINGLAAVPGGIEIAGSTQGSLGGPYLGGLSDTWVAKIVPEPGVGGLLMGAIGMLGMRRMRGRKG